MIKVINSVSHKSSHGKEIFNQFTKCGDIYVDDDSTDAFLLCSFCASSSEKEQLWTLEEFIDHIKWHRSDDEPAPVFETVVSEIGHEMPTPLAGDPIDLKPQPECPSEEEAEDIFARISNDCLLDIIDIFKKCPCLWHSATADSEKQYIMPAKVMITKYFNKITKRTESVEYVEQLLENIKEHFDLEKCAEEIVASNSYMQKLDFLLLSEMTQLDESIYTDFRCTICTQKLESWEFLWDHLCNCHMEIEDSDFGSIGFNDNTDSENEGKNSDNEIGSPIENPEFINEFIETYKSHPRLWNRTHPEYTNSTRMREKSYAVLRKVMEKYNVVATQRALLRKIKCFKTQYVYARDKMKQSKARDCVYVPHIWYYDKLTFLEDSIRHKSKPQGESLDIKAADINTHMGTTCTECNKKFATSMACLDHMQCGHDNNAFRAPDGIFYCLICNFPNKTKFSLIRHLRHTHSSNFKECDECGTKFRFMTALVKHKAKAHNDFRPFKCTECGKGFTNLNHMKIHSVTHWAVNDRPHVCEICSARFSNKANLSVHVRRHTRDFKIACKICDHKAATTSELQSHMLKHTKKFPCICDVCGKACRSKRVLQMHLDEVHGNVTYPCKYCDKRFKTRKRLLYHYDDHKTVADQVCETCGQEFFRLESLRKHMRRKHGQLRIRRSALEIPRVEDEYLVEGIEELEDIEVD